MVFRPPIGGHRLILLCICLIAKEADCARFSPRPPPPSDSPTPSPPPPQTRVFLAAWTIAGTIEDARALTQNMTDAIVNVVVVPSSSISLSFFEPAFQSGRRALIHAGSNPLMPSVKVFAVISGRYSYAQAYSIKERFEDNRAALYPDRLQQQFSSFGATVVSLDWVGILSPSFAATAIERGYLWAPPPPSPPWPSSGSSSTSEPSVVSVLAGSLVCVLSVGMMALLLFPGKPPPGSAGWGRWNLLYPRVWIKVWFGYAAMTLTSLFLIPAILADLPGPSSGGSSPSDALDFMPQELKDNLGLLVAFGPFVHCFLMPFFWRRKHNALKVYANTRASERISQQIIELDAEAKTVIFASKYDCGSKILIMTVGLLISVVDFVLVLLRYASGGTVDLRAFWFPMPFYNFWKAKALIRSFQIDGCRLRTTATQDDAYMKFCTEVMMNFWTLGLYGCCCSKRISYKRWLDRHINWSGKVPSGYNAQFRIFDDSFRCVQKIKILCVWLVFGVLLGGVVSYIPIVRSFWVPSLALEFYKYTLTLSNMRFGGSQPHFAPKFTFCNYFIAYYTIGICGFCSGRVKRWVDSLIVMGAPFVDEEMQRDSHIETEAFPDANALEKGMEPNNMTPMGIEAVPVATVVAPSIQSQPTTASPMINIAASHEPIIVPVAASPGQGGAWEPASSWRQIGELSHRVIGGILKPFADAQALPQAQEKQENADKLHRGANVASPPLQLAEPLVEPSSYLPLARSGDDQVKQSKEARENANLNA